jgi:hypothetical protein
MLRRLLLTVALLAPTVGATIGGSAAVHADDGLAVASTTSYTVDAASGVVHVRSEFTLSNTLPDEVQGAIINRHYFSGLTVPAPATSTNVIATTSTGAGLVVTTRPVPEATDFVLHEIEFDSNLFFPDTVHVNLSYDITGSPPRSENPSRVNPAYAAFEAFGIGDEGKVTVRVVVPAGFVVDLLGNDTTVSQENGSTVYTATDIPNPREFDIFVAARNDAALTSTDVSTPSGADFRLRSWPGDTVWAQFVTDEIHQGVPALAELVGQPWPIDGTVEVRQASTPYLYGYAGWFSAVRKEIEIGENLDPEVVLHELSHAWFSDEWFVQRWLSEGMAQVYSNQAVAALGGTASAPVAVDPTDPGKVALNDWGNPNFTDGADQVETYGYNAAFDVVQQMVDEVGDPTMRTVFAAIARHTIPYVGDLPAETVDGPADWRRFLDLVEEIGGATSARDLLEQYVVTADQAPLLADRAAARAAYRALATDGGEWAPPMVVRRTMTNWSFTEATGLIDAAEAVLALRTTLEQRSAELDVGYPDQFEADYEAADTDLSAVAAAVQDQIDAADAVLAAVGADARDDGLLATVGLWGTDVPALITSAKRALAAGRLDTARADAQRAVDTVDRAADDGTTRLLLAVGAVAVLIAVATFTTLLIRRRRAAGVPLDQPATGADDVTPD